MSPWQTLAVPVIAPAADGRGLTVIGNAAETVPLPHALVPLTLIFPDDADALKETVMLLVPEPEVMLAPGESPHEYPVALAIAGTVKT